MKSDLLRLGVDPVLTDDANELRSADKVLFPGQGEARTAMDYLREHHLDEVIKNLTQPVLGICIGQQLPVPRHRCRSALQEHPWSWRCG